MPTYSYRCTECDHHFDLVQRISEDPIRTCPACGQDGARREINSANFILKGSGWYSDLYSGGSNKKNGSSARAAGEGAAACDGSGACGAGPCATSTNGSSASTGGAPSSSSGSSASTPAPPASTRA